MGLFTRTTPLQRNNRLEFKVVVEEITRDEYDRLTKWVRENIPTTERFTPEWTTETDFFNSQPVPVSMMEKIVFKFRNEEHAMAFKLIL